MIRIFYLSVWSAGKTCDFLKLCASLAGLKNDGAFTLETCFVPRSRDKYFTILELWSRLSKMLQLIGDWRVFEVWIEYTHLEV